VLLPKELLSSLQDVKGFDKEAFEKVHATGEQVTSVRVNPAKWVSGEWSVVNSEWSIVNSEKSLNHDTHHSALTTHHSPLTTHPVPWSQYGYYLSQRPSFTFDPLFHAGCYYVQEASGMFLEQAVKQTMDLSKPLRILDLCASPGGKSTHIQSLISKESLLVSNEVIRSRANILKNNILKWGGGNVVVTNNDPKDFSKLENYFDAIVVDAPCSGSGLFRRDEQAIEEWSVGHVALCSQRQQRILVDVWPALKKGGILIYSTCSYSKEEDEDIADWMKKELSIVNCQLSIQSDWNITEVKSPGGAWGYRFWPDKVQGEGFFLACFRKTDDENEKSFKTKNKKEGLNKKELTIVEKWVSKKERQFIKHDNTVYAWPDDLTADLHFILERLRVIYSGTIIGDLMRDKLVPAHSLAMSGLVKETIPRIALNEEQAIGYLQKKERTFGPGDTGWHMVTYKGQNLGWVNILANRVNNYYPKELRILKDS
jgi:16S rRNA C967 or C1407 C5-methylase (RsmB/RsmF family)/NOL1/NOP2/fmu family ribosome biogenesis protein